MQGPEELCEIAIELRKDKEQPSDSDSDSCDDDSESDVESKQSAVPLAQVDISPQDYDGHLMLINNLKAQGEKERLRQAREAMNKVFPLSSELWLSWIEDERGEPSSSAHRAAIVQLFDRAVGDYQSIELWLEYIHFTIGYMGESDGSVEKVRSVFERALTAAGLHVSKGILLWESYREFEMLVLTSMVPESEGENAGLAEQIKRVANLFKRQLSVPLLNMQKTYTDFDEWLESYKDSWIKASGKADSLPIAKSNVDLVYKKALERLHQIEPYENVLSTCGETEKVLHFKEYLKFEQTFGDPVRMISLFERALSVCPLDAPLWLGYIEFFNNMTSDDSTLQLCQRAVRNCPWYSLLWQQYIRCMEKNSKSYDEVKDVFEEACKSCLQISEDFRNLWIEYCCYLRRRIDWGSSSEKPSFAVFRENVRAACDHLDQYFGLEGDPACHLLRLLAMVEAVHCRQMDEARKTWNEILNRGHKTSAASWSQYIYLEAAYGDSKHLKRLFARALQATQDWPESIAEEWLQFERVEGTLESYEDAFFKCRIRLKEMAAQREKTAPETETSQQSTSKAHTQNKKGPRLQPKSKKFEKQENMPEESQKRSLKRPTSDQHTGFKSAPPPGYQPDSPKRPKLDSSVERGVVSEHDHSKDDRTVFVSNLDFSTSEEKVREIFSSAGDITELRLVKDFKGRSKGFCYVVFTSHKERDEALKKDREPIDGRPIFVSKCDPDRHTRQHAFRWSTNLEKNKLFIKGLPLSTTKEDVEKLYEQYGSIKDIRMVTYRNGHFKGLVYIDFETEVAAAHALIKTDGMTIGDKIISVAISQPPDRRTSLLSNQEESSSTFVRSLGGGPREVGTRGRGRTQVSFVPRALQVKGEETKNGSRPVQPASSAGNSNGTTAPKSNADFRQMLLGKK